MLRWILAVVVVSGLTPRTAAARTCISKLGEHMTLERLALLEDGIAVESPHAPASSASLTGDGESVKFWFAGGLKGFVLVERKLPSDVQLAHIEASSARRLETSCGHTARFKPILPGRYEFSAWHSDSTQFDAKFATVSPDRQRVTIEFMASGHSYAAEYEVVCAYFDHDDPKVCGPKELHEDPARPVPPSREAPRIAPPPVRIEGPPALEEGGCELAGAGPPGLLALVLLRRARRRTIG